jgi:hypothetical protein
VGDPCARHKGAGRGGEKEMRQNRCDPLGRLHAVPERGGWMGNRGCLHDAEGRIRRDHAGRRWITCLTGFRGRRRALMQPGRYTELFFLDEATAYAAGHRPCAECRRADYLRFADLWAQIHGPTPGADRIDAALHAARLQGRSRRLWRAPLEGLPPGAMVLAAGTPALVAGGSLWRWSHAGYTPSAPVPGCLDVLTPEPVVGLMRAGLPVQMALPPRAPAVSPCNT